MYKFFLGFFLVSCQTAPQLQDLLSDRPNMKIDSSSKIYIEAEKCLSRITWKNREPQSPHASQITLGNELLISSKLSLEESWICFFYESVNHSRIKEFEKLWKNGKTMTRDEWVYRNCSLENLAGKEFLKILDTLLVPEFKRLQIDTVATSRYRNFFLKSPEEWMKSPANSYPWNFWGSYYDKNFLK